MVISSDFERGIQEFNQQQFYSCHDTLEAIWVEAPEVDKRFYQGILQVAVGCYHLSNDNLRGAIILLGEAIRRLCDYQPEYEGINVELLLGQANDLLLALQQLEVGQGQDFFEQLKQKKIVTRESPLTNADEKKNLINSCQIPYICMVTNEN